MESALSALILFTLGLFAALTLSVGYLEMQDSLWQTEQLRETQNLERARTDIAISQVSAQDDGAAVEVKVRNTGQVKLADFDHWDLIVQYYAEPENAAYRVMWLPYTEESPDELQWTVSGIYVAGTYSPEVFEPGILNPDEELVIRAIVTPTVATTTTNYITISSINGIETSAHFSR